MSNIRAKVLKDYTDIKNIPHYERCRTIKSNTWVHKFPKMVL